MKTILVALATLATTYVTAQVPNTTKMNNFINALMKKMTLEEKLGQLNLLRPSGGVMTGATTSSDVEKKIKAGKVGAVLGVEDVNQVKALQEMALQSRLKIPMIFGLDVIHGYKTVAPIPLAQSCSWDMPLIERAARSAATEATADGINWTYSPMVDIARDARWGRIAEGAGEDPYLVSQVAKAMVHGYQGNDLSKNNTLLACVKHFALYGAAEAGRDYNTTDMSRLRMYNEYLPPYKAAVDAGAASVMSSFNEVDGIPATGNHFLLTDVLRKQWGFDGFVVSDYTSINEMTKHGMGDLQTVSALSLNAGLDMDMVGEGFFNTLPQSLKEKKVTQQQIDLACRRVLEAKYKLGLFDDAFRYIDPQRASTEILSPSRRAEVRDIARHTFVLLKNDSQTLPLQKKGSIALVGPLANDAVNMQGCWAISGEAKDVVTILQGIKEACGNNARVQYARGANITDDTVFAKRVNFRHPDVVMDPRSPDEMIREALEATAQADVIVAAVGEASEMSGEASSRADIGIPESQRKLIRALAATGKPLVLVVLAGRPLTLVEESRLATAILYVWHPGTEAGHAISDVLFGDYNPSGKLTTTFPRSVGQIPLYYNHKNTGRPSPESSPKHRSNYLDEAIAPLYPFGYGLSYTKFAYSAVQLDKKSIRPGERLTASVTVTNTGNYAGEEVVQLYLRDVVGSITRPVKELKGFQKISLKPGESKVVRFTINVNDLKFYNSDLKWVAEPGAFNVMIGGNAEQVQEADFQLLAK